MAAIRRQIERLCPVLHQALAGWLLAAMIASLVVLPVPAPATVPLETAPRTPKSQNLWKTRLSKDQRIIQLLNRITFGPQPGQVAQVRRMGIRKFLDQQLHPERLDDSAVDARIAALNTYSMTTREIALNYGPAKFNAKLKAARERRKAALEPSRSRPQSREVAMAGNHPKAPLTPRQRALIARRNFLNGPQRPVIQLAQEEVLRAVYSKRQLLEVMVHFWMNHFNIYAEKGADRWMLTSFERDVIRPNAMGNFETLLVATAESPAMLFYLDNWMSRVSPDSPYTFARMFGRRRPRRALRGGLGRVIYRPLRRPRFGFGGPLAGPVFRTGPLPGGNRLARRKSPRKKQLGGINENYGRELMELHTLGVNGGYTQKDVIEVARCLTGWTILRPQQAARFVFNPRMHDYGPKVVLGHKIPEGHGISDGLRVLHILASSRATAHHICYELCQHFVADDPPESVVDRATATWMKTDGSIRDVLKTILTSPEFYSKAAYRAKVKSPFEMVASALRALEANTNAGLPIIQALAQMGEPMFQYEAPSGYYDLATTWVNSGALLMRMNFAMLLAANRIPGTEANLRELDAAGGADSPRMMVNEVSKALLGAAPSAATRRVIVGRLIAESAGTGPGGRRWGEPAEVTTTAGLLIGSPEFQRR
jgi:uncharacterized protein (DUF1800 family)